MTSPLTAIGFVTFPVTTMVTPLILIPFVVGNLGANGWSALALGQSIGAAVAVIVELGWALTGTRRAALLPDREARDLLTLSAHTKILAWLALSPVAAGIAAIAAPHDTAGTVAIAVGSSAAGFSQIWYMTGRSDPWRMILTDAVPRLLGVLAASGLLFCGFNLISTGVVLLVSNVGCLVIAHRANHAAIFAGFEFSRSFSATRDQTMAMLGRSVSSLYIALPITLVALVNPSILASYAAVERLMRMGMTGLASIPNMMQNWFFRTLDAGQRAGDSARVAACLTRTIVLNSAVGALAWVTLGFAGPWVAPILFSDAISIPTTYFWLAGGVAFLTCVSRATGGLILVGLNHVRGVTISSVFGACVGVVGIPLGASFLGAPGAFAGELTAELVVLTYQVTAVVHAVRKLQAVEPSAHLP